MSDSGLPVQSTHEATKPRSNKALKHVHDFKHVGNLIDLKGTLLLSEVTNMLKTFAGMECAGESYSCPLAAVHCVSLLRQLSVHIIGSNAFYSDGPFTLHLHSRPYFLQVQGHDLDRYSSNNYYTARNFVNTSGLW